jgi:hypothetical protein
MVKSFGVRASELSPTTTQSAVPTTIVGMTAVVIVTIATTEKIAVVVVTVAATDMTDIAEGMTVLLTVVTDRAPLLLAASKMTVALPGPHPRRGNMMIKDLQGMKNAPVATIEDVMTRTIDMMEGPPDTLTETRHSVGKRLVEVGIGHIRRWLRGPRTAAWSFSF